MDESYTFTDEDLWAYLATKQDDEVIGYCGNVRACLIAQAVQAKYPAVLDVDAFALSADGELGIGLWGPLVVVPLTPVLWEVMHVFDRWTGKASGAPVTKAEFMQAWQAYCKQF